MAESKRTFATIQIICGVVIERDGKYLLVQEKKPHVYGKWNLPSGRADMGESLEQTAIRETKEETGFDIRIIEELLTLHPAADRPVLHSYRAEIVSGELQFPKSELLDARWFSFDEILGMQKDLRTVEYVLGSIQASKR